MINQLTQDAEESTSTEKTASEHSESTTATAEAVAMQPEAPQAQQEAPPVEQVPPTTPPVQPEAPPVEQIQPATQSVQHEVPPAEQVQAATQETPAVQPESHAPQGDLTPSIPEASSAPAEETAGSNDIDFGAILEQFEQEQTVFHSGELVEGTVVGITDRGVLVDFGYKSEGFVPVEELTSPEGQMMVTVGEKIEVVIRSIHSGDSAPQLSRTDALGRKVWDDIETAFQNETPVIGKIVDKTKGGLKVDLNGIEAFLPGSQIDSRPTRGLDTYIGQDIEAKIIKFSRRRNNIVLSRKVLTDEVVNQQKAETLSKIEVGYVVEGTIKNLTEYGAFVDIGGIDGLLHVTDMSWGRIHHPADQFKVGEHLQVKVLKLDRDRDKVSLGYKQLQPDPWSTVVEVYPVNTKIKGIVSSVTDYGVFVELEPGVEGLVHVSEISWSRRAQSPKRLFQKGQEVEVQVLGVDTVEKRISLGMKQFMDNPWDSVMVRYPVGSKVHGRVRNLTDFGAFIELEEGIDGLVHVSDISWAKKIKHPKDVLKKDQEVDAIVTSIDRNGQRLSLSMKDLTPSAWETFVATHRPGDVVRGKVSRFTNFGVFVELGEGLEGLCHISELSEERVERPEQFAKMGQEMDFKILRIEPSDQKIGLSHRAVGKDEEPVADTKMYSTEAKGGMASLGELANLKIGTAGEEAPAQDPEEKKKAKQAAKKAKAEEFAAKEAEATAQAERAETEEAPSQDDAAAVAADAEIVSEAPAESAPVAETVEAPEEGAAADAGSADHGLAESTEETQAAQSAEVAPEEVAAETHEPAEAVEAPAEETGSEPAAEAKASSPFTEEAAEIVDAPAEEGPKEEAKEQGSHPAAVESTIAGETAPTEDGTSAHGAPAEDAEKKSA
jgi:small subunit ribosomal protein S1